MTPKVDIIGGFPIVSKFCLGCGKELLLENASLTDGCPCNTPLGVNSMNETRWRLLMQHRQDLMFELEKARSKIAELEKEVSDLVWHIRDSRNFG